MSIFQIITSNHILNVGVVSCASAQIVKPVLYYIKTKRWYWSRMLGSGGMPSSHSSLVVGVSSAIMQTLGFESPLFALSMVFSIIVMHDAMGVRRAAGEQAKVLNKMMFDFSEFPKMLGFSDNKTIEIDIDDDTPEEEDAQQKELKEFLGHTPLEVLGGAIWGVVVALLMRK